MTSPPPDYIPLIIGAAATVVVSIITGFVTWAAARTSKPSRRAAEMTRLYARLDGLDARVGTLEAENDQLRAAGIHVGRRLGLALEHIFVLRGDLMVAGVSAEDIRPIPDDLYDEKD